MGVVDFRYANKLFNLQLDLFNTNPIDRAYLYPCSIEINRYFGMGREILSVV